MHAQYAIIRAQHTDMHAQHANMPYPHTKYTFIEKLGRTLYMSVLTRNYFPQVLLLLLAAILLQYPGEIFVCRHVFMQPHSHALTQYFMNLLVH